LKVDINLVKLVLCPLPENADKSRVSIVYNTKDDTSHPGNVDESSVSKDKITPQPKKPKHTKSLPWNHLYEVWKIPTNYSCQFYE